MDLYFTEGADLSEPEVLVQAAADVGMDPERTRQMLASDIDVARIEGEANAAKDAGVDGVPTFILGGVASVTGAQSPEVLADAIEQIATNRERFLAENRAAAANE
jgi:predicted DsbA family dithiol-disulfide isomerase